MSIENPFDVAKMPPVENKVEEEQKLIGVTPERFEELVNFYISNADNTAKFGIPGPEDKYHKVFYKKGFTQTLESALRDLKSSAIDDTETNLDAVGYSKEGLTKKGYEKLIAEVEKRAKEHLSEIK